MNQETNNGPGLLIRFDTGGGEVEKVARLLRLDEATESRREALGRVLLDSRGSTYDASTERVNDYETIISGV